VRRLPALALLAGCTIAPGPGAPLAGNGVGDLPSGYGTLRQEDVSIALVSGDLQMLVTPLHRSVTRVTAPDTERRLEALVDAHAAVGDQDGAGLFLVSFFSNRPDTGFDPEEVHLISQGFRLRPESISPLTPTWGQQRVDQREQAMAVYRYAGRVELESDLVLAYRFTQTAQWSEILSRIQAERGRVRARAESGRP